MATLLTVSIAVIALVQVGVAVFVRRLIREQRGYDGRISQRGARREQRRRIADVLGPS